MLPDCLPTKIRRLRSLLKRATFLQSPDYPPEFPMPVHGWEITLNRLCRPSYVRGEFMEFRNASRVCVRGGG